MFMEDKSDNLLGVGSEFGDGTRRVGMGVLFGESAEFGQFGPFGAKKLEVFGKHTRFSVRRAPSFRVGQLKDRILCSERRRRKECW